MTIETKYNIDDYVWLLGNGCVARKRVIGIEIAVISKTGSPDVKYNIEEFPNPMREQMIFPSKEALIQSL